jgi:hypothetical protein
MARASRRACVREGPHRPSHLSRSSTWLAFDSRCISWVLIRIFGSCFETRYVWFVATTSWSWHRYLESDGGAQEEEQMGDGEEEQSRLHVKVSDGVDENFRCRKRCQKFQAAYLTKLFQRCTNDFPVAIQSVLTTGSTSPPSLVSSATSYMPKPIPMFFLKPFRLTNARNYRPNCGVSISNGNILFAKRSVVVSLDTLSTRNLILKSGLGGQLREHIHAVRSWRGGPAQYDY